MFAFSWYFLLSYFFEIGCSFLENGLSFDDMPFSKAFKHLLLHQSIWYPNFLYHGHKLNSNLNHRKLAQLLHIVYLNKMIVTCEIRDDWWQFFLLRRSRFAMIYLRKLYVAITIKIGIRILILHVLFLFCDQTFLYLYIKDH